MLPVLLGDAEEETVGLGVDLPDGGPRAAKRRRQARACYELGHRPHNPRPAVRAALSRSR